MRPRTPVDAVAVPPLLSSQVLEHALSPSALEKSVAIGVDCTTGAGGHTEALLQRYPHLRMVCIDRDAQVWPVPAATAAHAKQAHALTCAGT